MEFGGSFSKIASVTKVCVYTGVHKGRRGLSIAALVQGQGALLTCTELSGLMGLDFVHSLAVLCTRVQACLSCQSIPSTTSGRKKGRVLQVTFKKKKKESS